mgnify:CR=1 FL=1
MYLKGILILVSLSISIPAFSFEQDRGHKNDASKVYFVSPLGSDKNNGSTQEDAFKTIQHALNLAHAGESIILLKGEYFEDLKTVRSGTLASPIKIKGLAGSVLKGRKRSRIFEINHSYIELSNFSINGKISDGRTVDDYRDKLVYIQGLKNIGVTGVKLLGMDLQYAKGECVRIKYLASKNEIAYTNIQHCGVRDFVFNRGKHNGESIYIGTAPEQVAEGKNPTNVMDTSHSNWIHNNVIESYGSECVDVKEGSHSNIIENNLCTQQKDPNVGGVSIRGNANTVRNNIIFTNQGAGIRLGGDTSEDGIKNIVYGNYLSNNAQGALKIMSNAQQNSFCGNLIFVEGTQKKTRSRYKQKVPLILCKEPK